MRVGRGDGDPRGDRRGTGAELARGSAGYPVALCGLLLLTMKPRVQSCRSWIGGWLVLIAGRPMEWYADWHEAIEGALTLHARLKQ